MSDPILERKEACTRPNEPKRCSDFDTDCAGVMCHASCHRGGIRMIAIGELVEMPPADGYCPYLKGAG